MRTLMSEIAEMESWRSEKMSEEAVGDVSEGLEGETEEERWEYVAMIFLA